MIYHNSEEGRLKRMAMKTSLKKSVTRAGPSMVGLKSPRGLINIIYCSKVHGKTAYHHRYAGVDCLF
jgi:hypothetical protein